MNIENNRSKSPSRQLTLSLAGVIAVVLRVVPHPPNFSGVGALGLYGGSRLRGWHAAGVTLGALAISDLLLWMLTGFDPKYSLGHLSRCYVYASFLLYIPIGRWLLRKPSIWSIAAASTAGAVQFFVVTNFCEWLLQPWQPYYDQIPEINRYSRDLAGLIACFVAALPFYHQEPAFSAHPFMLLQDARLGFFWCWLGDLVLTTVYFASQPKLEPAGEMIVAGGREVPT